MEVGSPLHAQGTSWCLPRPLFVARLTPAHTGNTAPSCLGIRRPAGHPHTRRERRQDRISVAAKFGTLPHAREHTSVIPTTIPYCDPPPHTWGTRPHRYGYADQARITPARARNSASDPSFSWQFVGHPRIRGKRFHDATALLFDNGSLPHARGTTCESWTVFMKLRLTPACAGDTPT
jgi:hypothetical protein